MKNLFEIRITHRIIAVFLIFVMAFTSLPAIAFAENDSESNVEQESQTEITDTESALALEEDVSEENVIQEESTTESTTFDLGNGKRMIVYHGQDVRYEEEDILKDYDPTLVSIKSEESENGENLEGYKYENRTGDIKHYIPYDLDEETPILTENGKYSISMTPLDKNIEGEPVERAEEKTLTPYEQFKEKKTKAIYSANDGTYSYEYTSLNQGIKESIILEEKPESNIFTFQIDIKGMYAELDKEQNIVLLNDLETGETVANIDKPFMNDASEEAYSEELYYDLEEIEEGSYLLTLTVSEGYLEDEERIYPVTIDPTATWKGSETFLDAYVINGDYADTNFYSTSTKLMIAGKGSDGTSRTYIKLPNIKSTLEDKYVDSAYLTVYETADCDPDQTVKFYRILESWSVSTITWNNKPTHNTSGAINSFTTVGEQYTAHKVKMTNTVRNYLNETNNPNYGILLRNATSSPTYTEFYGSRTSLTSYRPKLVVTYYDKPTAAATMSIKKQNNAKYTSSAYYQKGEDMYVSWTDIVSHNLEDVQYKIIARNDTAAPDSIGSSGVDLTSYRSLGVATEDGTNVKVPYIRSLPEGDYRVYIRGKDAGGMYGTAKYKNFYIDGTDPTLSDISITPETTSTEMTNVLTPTISWNADDAHFSKVTISVDDKTAIKATDTAGVQSCVLDEGQIEESGLHKIVVKAIDKAGRETAKELNYYVDSTAPIMSNCSITPVTTSSNQSNNRLPEITWTMNDTDIKEYKVYVNGRLRATKDATTTSWKGSATFFSSTDDYTIKIVAYDNAGNSSTRTFTHYLDLTNPSGKIKVTQQGTGEETSTVSDTANFVVNATDAHSGVASYELALYEFTDSTEGALVHSFGTATLNENYDFDTTQYENGEYRLKLSVVDQAGNRGAVYKPITILNRIDAPTVTVDPVKTNTAAVNWTTEDSTNLAKLQYRFDGSETWTDAYTLTGSETSGSFNVTLPDEEGAYKLYVRGIDKDGEYGKDASVTCILDKTAPTTVIERFASGYLYGTVSDDSAITWKLEIKEKTAVDEAYQQIEIGTTKANDEEITFIDLTSYAEGTEYTVRLTATDTAGNQSSAAYDIYKATGENIPSKESAAFRIQRPAYQSYDSNTIIFPTEMTLMELNDTSLLGDTKWYVNNHLVSEGNQYQDDFTTGEDKQYQEDTGYQIFAIRESLLGQKSYSSDIIRDGLRKTVDLSVSTVTDNTVTSTIDLGGAKVVALNLSEDAEFGQAEGAVYAIKTGNSDYVEISPNQKIYLSDIFTDKAYAEDLTLRVTAPEGSTLSDVMMDMDILDSTKVESFQLSYIENFRPEAVTIADKINYKTYVKWNNEITEDTDPDIYYEVYRSTDPNFSAEATDVAATEVRAGYFTEININYADDFYYRVRAVIEDGDTKRYSSYSDQVFGKVVDGDEYTKRMGIKEYWEFAEIDMPNGELNIEKSMGNLLYQQIDASLPNEQLEVDLTRTYNSQSSAKNAFGVGWTHDYDIELLSICDPKKVSDDNIVMKDGSGTIYHFMKQNGEYTSSLGKFISLTKEEKTETVQVPKRDVEDTSGNDAMKDVTVNSSYTVTTKDNLEYRFNSGGQMVYLQESNGNFILFEYEPEKGLLETVITNRNTAIEFTYNDESGTDPLTVKEITLPDGSSVEYEYEGNPETENVRLSKVTEHSNDQENPQSITYTYGYDNQDIPNVNLITDGNGRRYTVTYNDKDQVQQVTYPDGESINLVYGETAEIALAMKAEQVSNLENLNLYTSTITQRMSNGIVVSSETDTFNGFGNCVSSIDTEGNETTYTYEDHLLTDTADEVVYHYIDEYGYVQQATEEKTETTAYNDEENETSQTEEDGAVTEFGYDEDAPDTWDDYATTEVETAVVNGETETVFELSYEYDTAGNETKEYDAVSNTTTITEYYSSDSATGLKGEVKSEKEYLGDPTNEANLQSITTYTYSYDDQGNKTETTTQICGNETIVTTVVYDVMGREISNTDSRGKRTDHLYDGFGRPIKTVYTDGDIVTYTETNYDNNGNVIYERTENGTVTNYAYDAMNREVSRTITKGDFSKTWTTTYGYEDVSIYTGKGTDTQLIENAFVTTETDPDGYVTAKTWQDHKNQVVRKLENGVYVDLTYDDQGNIFTQYEIGQQQTDHQGLLTMFIYDGAGNLTNTVFNPTYNESGFYTGGNQTIVESSEFDASGNETASIDGEGHRTEYTYDVEGNVTSVILPDGAVTSAQYDVLNDDGTTTDIITDALSRQSKTISDKGDLQTFVADYGDGTVTTISMSYTYDAKENVTRETDAEGNYIVYLYDGKDRKTEAQHYNQRGTLTYVTRYTYESDASDNLKVMADYTVSDGTETLLRYTWYDYDELDRMIAMAELDGPNVPTESKIAAAKMTYSYDIDDNVTAITYPDNGNSITTVKFEYNQFKWPTKVLVDTDSKTDQLVREYAYGNDGKLASVKDYRGVLTGEDGYILKEYGYDSFERTNSITVKDSSDLTVVKESYAYTYDKNNNILIEEIQNSYPANEDEQTHELRTHTYDSNGRLTKTVIDYPSDLSTADTIYTYSYDAVGNRIAETESSGETTKSTEYVYNSLNQLVSSTEMTDGTMSSQKTYTYDKSGNQLLESDTVTLETREQTYDVAGNMTRLVKKTDGIVELTQENQYNGNGQRIRKSEADNTTKYFYQDGSVLYTSDGTDNLTSWNLLGSSEAVIGTTRGTGTAEEYYLYTKDIRESTVNIIDDTGSGVVSYQYDDFGETETFGDTDFFNEICYTGGIHDASTGIYYLNARYYDPASGIFLSQDSYRGELNDPASLNLYGYCQGNPITYTDPSGHIPAVVLAVWGIRAIKTARAVYKTAKVVKKTYKVAKSVKRITKTVSAAKKTYKAVKPAKKLIRATRKAKSSKNIKRLVKKSNRTSRIKYAKKAAYKNKKAVRPKAKVVKATKGRKKAGCFVAGTKVSAEHGFVPIEKIQVGDRVWSEDTATGKKALKKVKKIFVREKDSLIRLSVNGEVIETTEEHPFWVKEQGWIVAGNLKAGDIVKLQTGEYVPIETYEIVLLKETIKVYNFHVEDYECYYVSEQKVLVHNNCARKAPKYNNKEITELADKLGYKKTGETVKGQIVFKKGRKYIVQDIDSHNGGVWKMADSIKNLKSKSTRLGTYDKHLKRIGD